MNERRLSFTLAIVVLSLLAGPLATVRGAGGSIEGKVTDPKGAFVAGAAVTVSESETNQTFTGVTDQQGHFKIDGLPAGTYTVTVSAQGFSEASRANVKVEEGAVATVDLKLEIAPVEAAVTINPSGEKPNSDPIYQQLRQMAKNSQDFAGPYATVSNLVIKRDAATFTLISGEIYFAPTVENRNVGAVFLGEGELTLTPPTDAEKHNLALFIKGAKK